MSRVFALLTLATCLGCAPVEHPVAPAPSHVAPDEARSLDRKVGEQYDRYMQHRTGFYDDPALSAYVTAIGSRVAKSARCTGCRFVFRILDDPDPDAEGAMGGFVYVSRGMLALQDNEAELAGILGHEIGHVVARHAMQRVLREIDPFPRDDEPRSIDEFPCDAEREADWLGVQYAARAGYDAGGLSAALDAMAKADPDHVWSMSGGHPAPLSRIARTAVFARAWPAGRLGRARYLAAIDGMVVGPDPRRGYVKGHWFIRPDAGFRMQLPRNCKVVLDENTLACASADRKRGLELQRTLSTSIERALAGVYHEPGVRHDELSRHDVGQITALAGPLFNDRGTRRIGSIAVFKAHGRVFVAMETGARNVVDSLAVIDDPALSDVAPDRLRVERLARATTALELVGKGVALDQFCKLNHVEPDELLAAKRRVKRPVRAGAGSGATRQFQAAPR